LNEALANVTLIKMNSFLPKVWNRLTQLQAPIAVNLPGTEPHLKRWVCVYFNNPHLTLNQKAAKYSIWDFELDASKMSDYEGDEDLIMQNSKRIYASDDEQLLIVLKDLKADPKAFDSPWSVDYPM
jgi:hypothetical protein